MATVQNLKRLLHKLEQLKRSRGAAKVSIVVGFTAGYAVYVHEDVDAHHEVGQAKFLEQPAREKADRIAYVVTVAMQSGATLEESLMAGGLYLQREAQLLTPVEFGLLRNSAFTRKDVTYESVS